MVSVQKLRPTDITADRRAQARSAVNGDVVADYAEAMRSGVSFPAIVVFFDGDHHWLADGFHRLDAAMLAEVSEIDADVREGGLRDAVLFSVGANAMHGLRRTNEDKRNAVTVLLSDEEWSKWSDREIARKCAVSNPFVSALRASLLSVNSEAEPRTYTTRHGTVAQMDTSRIGARPAEPAPLFGGDNVIPLGDRLVPVVSEEAAEREADAQEAAEREDKRNAVLTLLNDEEWGKWSDRQIARRCSVSADLVGTVRRTLTVVSDSEPAPDRTFITKHGTISTMQVGRIA